MMEEKYNISTAQLLLHYSMRKGYTPIVKATSPRHLCANIEVENLVISDKDIAILDSWDKGVKGSLCMPFQIYSNLLLIKM
jgi:diketogulonate reductase-like aldo/keto reductase